MSGPVKKHPDVEEYMPVLRRFKVKKEGFAEAFSKLHRKPFKSCLLLVSARYCPVLAVLAIMLPFLCLGFLGLVCVGYLMACV